MQVFGLERLTERICLQMVVQYSTRQSHPAPTSSLMLPALPPDRVDGEREVRF